MGDQAGAITTCKKRITKKDVVILSVISVVTIFLFWKCRYGIANIDESFYLTIPLRLCSGDALFVDEWNLAQMAGILITPIVWLFKTITGGLNGIVLFMRYVFVMVQCLVAAFFYLRFRRVSSLGAACASVSFLLYAPFGIMALSYNSMAIIGLILCITFIGPNDKFKRSNFFFAGISFSASVLCCPYLVLVYFIYVISVVVRSVISKRSSDFLKVYSPVFSVSGAFMITLGAVFSATVFAAIVLSRATLTDIYNSLLNILDDPSHPPTSFFDSISGYIFNVFLRSKIDALIYTFLGITFLLVLFDKKKYERRLAYFMVASVLTFVLMLWYVRINYINMLMWPINVLGVFIPVLSERKCNFNLFCTFWLLGILYSLCSNWASNQNLYAISSAATVSTVGTIVMIINFCDECCTEMPKKYNRYIVAAISFILISTQLLTQTILRYQSVFWESGGMPAQTKYIENGVQAGIYVSEAALEEYDEMYNRIKILDKYDAKRAVFVSFDTRYYIYGGYDIGAFSAWLGRFNRNIAERLDVYYNLNPENLPEIGYIEINDPEIGSDIDLTEFAEHFANSYGYEWHYEADGIILVKNQ